MTGQEHQGIRRPPYWEGALAGERSLAGMRPLAGETIRRSRYTLSFHDVSPETIPPTDLLAATNASLTGAASLTPTEGVRGTGAGVLDGGTAIQISGNGTLAALDEGFSIGLWVKADSSTAADSVVLDGGVEMSKADGANPTALRVKFPDGREWLVDSVFDGSWHQITLTLDRNGTVLYILIASILWATG